MAAFPSPFRLHRWRQEGNENHDDVCDHGDGVDTASVHSARHPADSQWTGEVSYNPRQTVMNPEHFHQVEKLYHSARELTPDARGAFLAEACQGDEELRREVELLPAQDDIAGPMEQNAAGRVADCEPRDYGHTGLHGSGAARRQRMRRPDGYLRAGFGASRNGHRLPSSCASRACGGTVYFGN